MHRAFTIPVVLLAAVLGVGCVDDNSDGGIFITKNVAPGEDCTFSSSQGELFLPHGSWSVYSPAGYLLFPQMTSRVTAAEGQEDQRTIIVRGARVDIKVADATLAGQLDLARLENEGVTKFESLFSAPIHPNGGITDGGFELITRRMIDEIAAVRPGILTGSPSFRAELVATATVFGDMAGNEVTSQAFQFPVTLCNDCVVNKLGACPLPLGSEPRTGNPCNPFQDGQVDCCTMGDQVVCPATVATAAN